VTDILSYQTLVYVLVESNLIFLLSIKVWHSILILWYFATVFTFLFVTSRALIASQISLSCPCTLFSVGVGVTFLVCVPEDFDANAERKPIEREKSTRETRQQSWNRMRRAKVLFLFLGLWNFSRSDEQTLFFAFVFFYFLRCLHFLASFAYCVPSPLLCLYSSSLQSSLFFVVEVNLFLVLFYCGNVQLYGPRGMLLN
jgi:hypothetical protein